MAIPASSSEDRDTYCANLEARVDALRRRIEDLERREETERLERPGHEPGPDIRDLQARHDELSRALARCQFAERDDWITARDAADSAFRRVEDAVETAFTRFGGRGRSRG